MPKYTRPLMVLALLAGCAKPRMVQMPPISMREVRMVEQEVATERSGDFYAMKQRFDSLAYQLAYFAAVRCGPHLHRTLGISYTDHHRFLEHPNGPLRFIPAPWGATIQSVTPGSPAHEAGLLPGDVVLTVNGRVYADGESLGEDVIRDLMVHRPPEGYMPYEMSLLPRRDGEYPTAMRLQVVTGPTCPVGTLVQGSEANAYADATSYVVTDAMVHATMTDAELLMIMAHELGHIVAGHSEAKFANVLLGSLADAALCELLGRCGNDLARMGAVAHSQDFEREADYLALCLLKSAGLDATGAEEFWRRMATDRGLSYSLTHPAYAERYVRMRNWEGTHCPEIPG